MSTRTKLLVGTGWWIAILASALLSLYLAHAQSVDEEVARAEQRATEILERARVLAQQTVAVAERLDGIDADARCSAEHLRELQQIALDSSQLRAIGVEQQGIVRCSSLGQALDGYPLGPVDYRSRSGADVRLRVRLEGTDAAPGVVFARGGYFALIHSDTMMMLLGDGADTSAALVSASTDQMLASRGDFDASWWAKQRQRGDRFFDGEHLVVTRALAEHDIAAKVSIRADLLQQRLYRRILVMLPLGLALGAALALVLQRLLWRWESLPAVLRAALDRGEFQLHYQPIVDLHTGALAGCEALLRWPRDDGPGLPPSSFLPIAESCGLMPRLSRYLIDAVARDAPTLIAEHPAAYVSLNLTPTDLGDAAVMAALADLPARSGLPARHFLIEVTEQSFADPQRARRSLEQIRALGMRVAIDDFGTGFSGLSRLGEMPSDCLKIDRSFVEAIGTDSPTREVAAHIIGMADALGLTSIGEGIETASQADFLRQRGVRYGQGWLYGRALPMPALLRDYPAVGAPLAD